jgi:hypothetical protein
MQFSASHEALKALAKAISHKHATGEEVLPPDATPSFKEAFYIAVDSAEDARAIALSKEA